jgi:DNA-binding NarL/FixJ family response regulator
MRVLLIGPVAERDRLRVQLPAVGLELAGEFTTVADARESGVKVDALLLAGSLGPSERGREPLTPREIQVIELLAEGLSNKMIAGKLGISDQTVKFHVAAICGKLAALNRTDAVRRAIRRGIVAV